MNNLLDTVRPGHAPPATRLYAIGDLHGQLPLLEELHEAIRRDLEQNAPERVVAVYLGDYVDRGRDTHALIDLLASNGKALGDRVETVHLAGNHEDLMLAALDADQAGTGRGAGMMMSWLQNGGVQTLASYGVEADTSAPFTELADTIREAMANAMPAHHRTFLEQLKPYHREGGYLFVHAGIRPGVPLEQQSREDLLWIRKDFLDCRKAHPFVVVHGHTPTRLPEMRDNRLGIDTGAFATGRLTCVVLEGADRRLLVVNGQPV